MVLVLLLVVGAIGVAWVCGGTFGALAALPVRWRWLLPAAVAAQLVGGVAVWASGHGYVAGLVASAVLAAAFCLRNLRLAGLPLITLGLVANAIVVGANGAMPVSAAAARHAGVSLSAIAAGTDPRHAVADHTTTLRILGDVVPAPLPGRPEVLSPGDILVTAGLAELIVVAMRGRWRRSPSRPRAVRRTRRLSDAAW